MWDSTVAVERLAVREPPRRVDLDPGGRLEVGAGDVEEALWIGDLVQASDELIASCEQRLADRQLPPARGVEEIRGFDGGVGTQVFPLWRDM